MYSGEIITIGDELLSGRVRDVNSGFLSGRLTSLGLRIDAFSTVGDLSTDIADVLGRAIQRSDFVLCCGGLGPTEDDMTAQAAADFFGRPLVVDEIFLEGIRRAVTRAGMTWLEGYAKLAQVPEGARLIAPDEACGFYLFQGQVPVFFLPGIPSEVRRLAEIRVFPLLREWAGKGDAIRQRVFKLFGLHEARIGDILTGLDRGDARVQVGFYPNFPENHVTITIRDHDEARADELLNRLDAELQSRLGPHVVALDQSSLEESLGRLLTVKGKTLAVAESCTGGLIGHRVTAVPGSSAYFERGLVVYSNQAKMDLLGVPDRTLKDHGAVSMETARIMADEIRTRARVDYGLATTGIAGPDGGTKEKPVGTVYIGLSSPEGTAVRRFRFTGGRSLIKELTAETALYWLYRYLSLGPLDGGPQDAAPRMER